MRRFITWLNGPGTASYAAPVPFGQEQSVSSLRPISNREPSHYHTGTGGHVAQQKDRP